MRRIALAADDIPTRPRWTGVMNSRRAVLAPAVLLALPLLAGCQAFGINEQYDASYADLAAIEESWDSMRVPKLVPADAHDIRLGYNTIDEGQVMAFASDDGITADYCVAGTVDGAPAFEPGWWAAGDVADEGWTCGDWSVVADGDRYLVWD